MSESTMGAGIMKIEIMKNQIEKLEENLRKLGLKIKHHEDNLKFLKSELDSLDLSIVDMQVSLGKYHASCMGDEEINAYKENEQQIIVQVLAQENSAAGIICQLKTRYASYATKLPLMKDVIGVVATLGKVDDDNLSRLLSEYLGLDNMLAIVCKTFEGVKALEKYSSKGTIDKTAGLHVLGPSIGRCLEGRFLVFCLENIRPFVGDFVAGDPQKKLSILKPRLPNGESPPGFLGYAVNMIILEPLCLSCLTSDGHGLRETLFYSLFSRLQVYKSREQMELAIPCITSGAISLDGGIMKCNGVFLLGSRKETNVRFPVGPTIPNQPATLVDIQEQIKLAEWKKERLLEDMQREESLLKNVKHQFSLKKEEFLNFINEATSSYKQDHLEGGPPSGPGYNSKQN